MYEPGEVLLYALSARREVSWRNFKQYFDAVHRRVLMEEHGNASYRRWQFLRGLTCLGHIDLKFDHEDIRVVAAPPTLAVLPGLGSTEAILCGARSPTTVEQLEQVAADCGVEVSVKSQTSANPFAPTRVALRAEDTSLIRSVGKRTRLRFMSTPPARLLARISTSVQDYIRELEWSREPELNWRREDYDVERLRFQVPAVRSSQLRLTRYQDPVRSTWLYRLWRDGESAGISDVDWGRYAILALASKRILRYDRGMRDVLVPLGAPLPTLLARALGLCSGFWPEDRQSDRGTRSCAFRDIPPSILEMATSKLGQMYK